MLTTAQLASLKAAIEGDANLTALVAAKDTAGIADYFNQPGSANVWRPDIRDSEIVAACVMSEVVALNSTPGAQLAFQTLIKPDIIDATSANVRQAFTALFAANTTTRANLIAIAQRVGTRFEVLLSTGSVSAVFGQKLTAEDVAAAKFNDNGTVK
jgi:hypothetical protein